MVNFYLSISDNGDVRVYRRSFDLFNEAITLMGWFASYNLEMAKAFQSYLENNPHGDLNTFFRHGFSCDCSGLSDCDDVNLSFSKVSK